MSEAIVMTKREKSAMRLTERVLADATLKPVPVCPKKRALQHVVTLRTKWENRIGWKPPMSVTCPVHRMLLNASFDLFEDSRR